LFVFAINLILLLFGLELTSPQSGIVLCVFAGT